MRPRFIYIFTMLVSLALTGHANDNTPVGLPLSRYQKMIDRSPFAVASENAPVAAPAAGFAKDLVLTGAAHLFSGDYVAIATRDQSQIFSLRSGENYNGISLVNVAWSKAIGKTRATLKCGPEFATISFDEATLRQAFPPEAPPQTQRDSMPKPILPPGVTPPNLRKR